MFKPFYRVIVVVNEMMAEIRPEMRLRKRKAYRTFKPILAKGACMQNAKIFSGQGHVHGQKHRLAAGVECEFENLIFQAGGSAGCWQNNRSWFNCLTSCFSSLLHC